jgi:hypothetical protein
VEHEENRKNYLGLSWARNEAAGVITNNMKTSNLIHLSLAAAMTLMLAGCAFPTGSGSSASTVSAADLQKRQQALASSDNLIVPGQRIGPISLGMGMDQVAATLGQPDESRTDYYPNGGAAYNTQWWYDSIDMVIGFTTSAAPSVKSVETQLYANRSGLTMGNTAWSDLTPGHTTFQTASGIRLGSSSFDVARTYGAYTDLSGIIMTYDHLGMVFTVTDDHRIYAITVYPPK